MNIEDFEIKIKKYDREKNFVIANVVILGELELRGFVIRYTETKYTSGRAVWVVSPPSVKGRKSNYFWVVKLKNNLLWQQLRERLVDKANEYANSI
jgi:hypothetical protein